MRGPGDSTLTGRPAWFNKAWVRWGGHYIGNVVVLKYDPDADRGRVTPRNEQEHVRQCMVLGIFQPTLCGFAYLGLLACLHANPYYDNPLDIDARRASSHVVGVVKRAYATGKLKPPAQK